MDAAYDTDILIFVLSHQIIERKCRSLVGKIKPAIVGSSLINNFLRETDKGIVFMSYQIDQVLKIKAYTLICANPAHEVVDEKFAAPPLAPIVCLKD